MDHSETSAGGALAFFRALVGEHGSSFLAERGALGDWLERTDALLAGCGADAPRALRTLFKSYEWRERFRAWSGVPAEAWARDLERAGGLVGKESLGVLIAESETRERALLAIAARQNLLEQALERDDAGFLDTLIADTAGARALLESLRDRPATAAGSRTRRLFPELAALAVESDPVSSFEHERSNDGAPGLPLLDHLSRRVLARKLAGLERGEIRLFQRDQALSVAAFADERARLERLRSRGLLPCLRAALIHLDFAKGGDEVQRAEWRSRANADLTVHNRAARQILEGSQRPSVLARFSEFRGRPALESLALALIESHGLAGQSLRGETPRAFFAPWIRYLRGETSALAEFLGVDRREAVGCALDCLHLVNVCDTAGVREGLLTDALRAGFLEIRSFCEALALDGDVTDEAAIERSLHENADGARSLGELLLDRLCRLRAGRLAAGEPASLTERALASQNEDVLGALGALFARCQFWYAEAGSAVLSPEAQLKVFALGMLAASQAPGVAPERLFHVNLSPLVRALKNPDDPATAYRVRLIETMLGQLSLAQVLEGSSGLGGAGSEHPLGTFVTTIGGASAVELTFRESREAAALLTLLPIYESKSSVAFHATLKTLCDLYGLRKDEFDRVANESLYLATMNSARSDKERMLDHVRMGRIVEVGPGGGVVLDLLERRFPESEIIGIDASHQVAESLRQRRELERRRWSVVEADAFRLPEVVGAQGADCVIFCSVLHEIYSYVRYPNSAGEVERFRLESVRDLLRAAYESLKPRGRIVIRDGIMPPPGERIVRFLVPDAREFFELFCRQFEGRRIQFELAGDDRVRLSSADAMEFLYTYTWGPESFPYEVREQYGILTYQEYSRRILEWLSDFERPARAIELPPQEASYLQEGYRRGLAGKVELFDGAGHPVELPDSNCLIVIEKS